MTTTQTREFWTHVLETPTGNFALHFHDDRLIESGWAEDQEPGSTGQPTPVQADVIARFEAYFRGEAVDFDDVDTPEGPPFFHRCWDACRAIPRGTTLSYGALAEAAGGTPGSARAAGQAMRRNPLPIVVPCHRVVASDGDLHGFSGSTERGGVRLSRKALLLVREGWDSQETPSEFELFPHNPPADSIDIAQRRHDGSSGRGGFAVAHDRQVKAPPEQPDESKGVRIGIHP